jgi:hypothetical protein
MNDYTKQLEAANEALSQKLAALQEVHATMHKHLYLMENVVGYDDGTKERVQTVVIYGIANLKSIIDAHKARPFCGKTPWTMLGYVIRKPSWAMIENRELMNGGSDVTGSDEYFFKPDFTWIDGWEWQNDKKAWVCKMTSSDAGVYDMRFLQDIGVLNLTELPDG